MKMRLHVEMLNQPDDFTCGPTCLDAIYRYYGDELPLMQVVAEVPQLETGGTLAVFLACHALRRGYRAVIYTYNLQVFDPTWFDDQDSPGFNERLADRLRAQRSAKTSKRLAVATEGYLEFLSRGGVVRFQDLSVDLLRKYLRRETPILTGLSATYLYHMAREFGPLCTPDDVRGEPAGHFVVLCGVDEVGGSVAVADPYPDRPAVSSNYYSVGLERAMGAILLGIMTHDANLLVIEPVAAAVS
ncbi:MAG: hypothetical protein ACRC1K_23885 [Planctomycetia bacterium]